MRSRVCCSMQTSIAIFVFMLTFLSPALLSQSSSLPKMSESGLRSMAKSIVKPEFPPEAIHLRQTGVAVAKMTVDENGKVAKVEILEAPSKSIGTSVLTALLGWHFDPSAMNGQPTGFTGKVTYYFVFQKGLPVVLSPAEAAYLGPQGR
jgi:TonB family protein